MKKCNRASIVCAKSCCALVGALLLALSVGVSAQAQDLAWAKRAGGSLIDRATGIGVDAAGNSYVTGAFQDSATFGPGEANETTLTSAGSQLDIFVAKFVRRNR